MSYKNDLLKFVNFSSTTPSLSSQLPTTTTSASTTSQNIDKYINDLEESINIKSNNNDLSININFNNKNNNSNKCVIESYDSHTLRIACKNCKKSENDITINCNGDNNKTKSSVNDIDLNNNNCDYLSQKYDWFPKNANIDLILKYMNELPLNKRPIKSSDGAKYRRKQIETQLPMHDFSLDACDTINSEYERKKFNEFIQKYEKVAVGVGKLIEIKSNNKTCEKCKKAINIDEIAIDVNHPKGESISSYWHVNCFCCNNCNELLVDLIYYYNEKSVYCGRHFGEQIRPRCAACDELIFSKEYTKAENRNWHLTHFCCWKCDKPLGGTKYLPIDSKPHCISCYDVEYAKECDTCHQKINAELQRVTYNNLYWHADPSCFSCFMCRKSLLGKQFVFKSGYIFCSVECKRRIIPKNSNQIGDVVQF